jgi:hypothetical protein
LAIAVVSIPYLVWDYFFTQKSYWGFEDKYISGIYLFNLPIEEVLFFIVMPYACAFTFYALRFYFPNFQILRNFALIISCFLVIGSIILLLVFYHLPYTRVNFIFLIIVLIPVMKWKVKLLQVFLWVFPIILIPFFIVNGILTGSFINDQVVWYNPEVFMGIRIFTVPVEDVFYAFSLILANLFMMELLMNHKPTQQNKVNT